MKSSWKISFLLLLAMGLTLLPAPSGAAYDLSLLADDAPCETSQPDTCHDSACAGEPIPVEDNCCEPGCQHCSLPCCTGTVMLPALAQGQDPALTDDGRLVATTTDLPRVDADPFYHPPRG